MENKTERWYITRGTRSIEFHGAHSHEMHVARTRMAAFYMQSFSDDIRNAAHAHDEQQRHAIFVGKKKIKIAIHFRPRHAD